MKKIFQTSLLVFIVTTVAAQQTDYDLLPVRDTIRVEKFFGGYQLRLHNERLTIKDVELLLADNQMALKELKSSKAPRTLGMILGVVGGAMIGFPLGAGIGGGDPNLVVASIGVGLAAISIPISISANKKLKKAVNIYNTDIRKGHYSRTSQEVRLQVISNGVGIAWSL